MIADVLLPLAFNSKSDQSEKLNHCHRWDWNLAATFGMLAHLSDHLAKSHPISHDFVGSNSEVNLYTYFFEIYDNLHCCLRRSGSRPASQASAMAAMGELNLASGDDAFN
jgi:hypothetical protein